MISRSDLGLARRVAVAVCLLTLAVSCSDDTRAAREPEVQTFTVPPGTAVRIAAGEVVPIMPARIDLRVGDTIKIVNDDSSDQYVGPWFVRAGRTFEAKYQTAGEFVSQCSFTETGNLVISVKK